MKSLQINYKSLHYNFLQLTKSIINSDLRFHMITELYGPATQIQEFITSMRNALIEPGGIFSEEPHDFNNLAN